MTPFGCTDFVRTQNCADFDLTCSNGLCGGGTDGGTTSSGGGSSSGCGGSPDGGPLGSLIASLLVLGLLTRRRTA
jgi:hypothetical protein